MTVFHDAATRVECDSIARWKKDGKPVVGYTCSYTPAEIFYAVDILPVRLRGIETDGMEVGDSYFGPFICSFPKCILQLAGKGRFSFLDGAIITPGCDGMRRLDECWRKAGEDFEGIVPDYFYYFDVPHKSENHGMAWYIEEINQLIKRIILMSILPMKNSKPLSENSIKAGVCSMKSNACDVKKTSWFPGPMCLRPRWPERSCPEMNIPRSRKNGFRPLKNEKLR